MSLSLSFAPFRGITNKTYRRAFQTHIGGFDRYYAPFVTGSGQQHVHPSKLEDLDTAKGNRTYTIPQILSNDAAEIAAFARAVSGMGYEMINWNLGCPFRRITHKKRGSGLLPYPDAIRRILEQLFRHEIFASRKMSLSVKTRTGYFDAGEIYAVIDILNLFPLKEIILHPRTGLQLYSGEADPGRYADVKSRCRHKLIYNGDIINTTSFRFLQGTIEGQSHWMIGRGALINPFLANEIRGVAIPADEKRERLHAFHRSLWEHAKNAIPGEQRQTGWMKAIWHYMSGLFSDSVKVFAAIKRTHTEADFLVAANDAIGQPFASDRELEEHFRKLTR